MDFAYSEEQDAVRSLAADVFAARANTTRIDEIEKSDDRLDRDLWAELANLGLLGIALPEELGGGDLGIDGLAVLLEQQGRFVVPIPLWPSAIAALALAQFGTDDQRALATAHADGSAILTVALEEFGPYRTEPTTRATRAGDGWTLTGAKACVPVTHVAQKILVTAATDDGPAVFVVDPAASGVSIVNTQSTTHEICGLVDLTDTPAELLGATDGSTYEWLVERAELALAAVQLGVGRGAIEQSVEYLNGRQQFGRPLATFQAVAHQMADSYIDLEAMSVTLWQGVQRASTGDGPETAVLVAKWWASDAGQRIVHRAVHVHGGMGVDVSYPVHRYLLWGKQIGATLGGPGSDLDRIGDALAAGAEVNA